MQLISKIGRYFVALTYSLAFVLLMVIGYYMFYPIKTIDIESPIEVMNKDKKVEVGGLFLYKIKYKKYINLSPTLQRQFVDTISINFPPVKGSAPIGDGELINSIPVPETAWTGKYRMRWAVTFEINSFRTITKVYETEDFYIVPKGHVKEDKYEIKKDTSGK